jgi:hypothetical protein
VLHLVWGVTGDDVSWWVAPLAAFLCVCALAAVAIAVEDVREWRRLDNLRRSSSPPPSCF